MASEELALAALDEHADRLSALPNVVGLGVVSREEGAPGSDDLAVGVYVEKKVPRDELADHEVIPPVVRLQYGAADHDVPVRIVVSGAFSTVEPDRDDPDLGFATGVAPEAT